MTTLVLHRYPLGPFPYDRWLAEEEGGVVLLAARDRLAGVGEEVPASAGGYRHIEWLDSFDTDDALVTRRAEELVVRFGVTRVLARHEGEVLRAAALRDTFDLPGSRVAEVLPYRDKVLMKQLAQVAGVEVAPHTVPRSAREVADFAERHGLPLVFKERAGFGSIGLRIARTPQELQDCVGALFPPGLPPAGEVLLEAFVPGRMCHVDGVIAGGRTRMAWPSQYQYDLASFHADEGARIDLTLGPEDPLTPRLLDLTERVLDALGRPADGGFHAEVFHTPDDRLVLCEIACRPGGARIREVLNGVFGVHPEEYASRAEVGLPLPAFAGLGSEGRLAPRSMAGQVLLMKRPGRVVSVPAPPEEEWVAAWSVSARPGDVLPPATMSSDFLATAVVLGPDRAECERRLRETGARIEKETSIL